MMRIAACLFALTLLAACGVDGEPERPAPAPAPGIVITGVAEVGVSG